MLDDCCGLVSWLRTLDLLLVCRLDRLDVFVSILRTLLWVIAVSLWLWGSMAADGNWSRPCHSVAVSSGRHKRWSCVPWALLPAVGFFPPPAGRMPEGYYFCCARFFVCCALLFDLLMTAINFSRRERASGPSLSPQTQHCRSRFYKFHTQK